jgi:hypothetical protein
LRRIRGHPDSLSSFSLEQDVADNNDHDDETYVDEMFNDDGYLMHDFDTLLNEEGQPVWFEHNKDFQALVEKPEDYADDALHLLDGLPEAVNEQILECRAGRSNPFSDRRSVVLRLDEYQGSHLDARHGEEGRGDCLCILWMSFCWLPFPRINAVFIHRSKHYVYSNNCLLVKFSQI